LLIPAASPADTVGMQFRITKHAVGKPPENALDLLAERIGSRRDGVTFKRAGTSISARLDRDDPVSMTSDERAERGRHTVLEMLGEVCEQHAADIKLEWYAVRPVG
jgi:hypothetical protein